MKSEIKKIKLNLDQKVFVLCLLCFILALTSNFLSIVSNTNKYEVISDQKNETRTYQSTTTPINSIYIDDANPSYNWETFAMLHAGDSWFTNASGTEYDPYIIENVSISGAVYSIYIINSKAHFWIIYSKVTYSQYNGQAIYLSNVSNANIKYNNFTYNNRGMMLSGCNNSVIEGNYFNNNDDGGISFVNSHDNIIFNNTFNRNRYDAVELYESNNNLFYENTFRRNGRVEQYDHIYYGAGIKVSIMSSNNSILDNSFKDNLYCGIELSHNSRNTTIIENNFNDNSLCAIMLDETNNNTINENIMINEGILFDGIWDKIDSNEISSTNLVNNKPIYFYVNRNNLLSYYFINAGQVILINCTNIIINSLDLSSCSVGLTLYNCTDTTLDDIDASNNYLYGIFLTDCINVTISGSLINNNGACGILLDNSDNCKILESEVSFTDYLKYLWLSVNNFPFRAGYGIYAEGGGGNLIFENSIQSNNISGLMLNSFSHGNNISNNNFNDNNIFIDCSFNKIFNNTFETSRSQILLLRYSGHTIVSENTFNGVHEAIRLEENRECLITKNIFKRVQDAIILMESNSNNITENTINGNGGIGIKLYSSSYNKIEGNKLSGVIKCFVEYGDSTSNQFINNECDDIPSKIKFITIIIVTTGILSVGIILTIVFIRRRKHRKIQK
jgi:parallel beta-helix repeat protein